MDALDTLIVDARHAGIVVKLRLDDRLDVSAPMGAEVGAIIERLRDAKPELVARLRIEPELLGRANVRFASDIMTAKPYRQYEAEALKQWLNDS